MSDVRQRMEAVQDGTASPEEILQEVVRVKSEEIVSEWADNPGKNSQGMVTFSTAYGEATIGDIQYFSSEDGLDGVEVWTGPNEGNSPAYRLINPPLMVADPLGEVIMPVEGTNRVKRYRVDPLHAIAEFIALHSGKAETG